MHFILVFLYFDGWLAPVPEVASRLQWAESRRRHLCWNAEDFEAMLDILRIVIPG